MTYEGRQVEQKWSATMNRSGNGPVCLAVGLAGIAELTYLTLFRETYRVPLQR